MHAVARLLAMHLDNKTRDPLPAIEAVDIPAVDRRIGSPERLGLGRLAMRGQKLHRRTPQLSIAHRYRSGSGILENSLFRAAPVNGFAPTLHLKRNTSSPQKDDMISARSRSC
jgi:hypothetical protein